MYAGSIKRQQGLTFVGWVFLLVIVAFLVFAAVKIFPVYMTEFEVSSSLSSLGKDHDMANAPKEDIRRRLQKLLDVNDIDYPSSREARISGEQQGSRTVKVPYEVRVPFTRQIAVVFSFSPSTEISRR